MSKPIRVIIVDDHLMVVEGLKALLNSDPQITILNAFVLGQAALDFLASHPADVVLLDINLPDMSGVEVCRLIHQEYPDTRVIGLSTYREPSIIQRMIKYRAAGYLLKNATAEELSQAIRQVHAGHQYFGAEIQKVLADSVGRRTTQQPRLTRREKHIVRLIAEGLTTQQMADTLFISPLTVETHRRNVMKKMNVANAAALIRAAGQQNII